MEDNIKKGPQKKMEDDEKNNGKQPKKKSSFLIPLKFRGKPFLGLAQLSKIFIYLLFIIIYL